ncbi:FKBP-type peptidyl-prolyl cis-trans isomerase [Geopsychrobacter electrodiphilus]|uniref:FKBP-type peptidyl-prolyl cis-trans isomerase n=1 Tax=Geopsychrobacter electrodiphilus TaxID=225196 RepID=UPI00036DCD8A|nr:peptidylprolyl isomerase [Geopsychrobacter electrodiphilus]
MQIAKPGDRVSIHYIGTLDNGYVFDSAESDNPLSFTLGEGEVFPALEQAVVGMPVGSAMNIEIKAAEAYGPRRAENLLRVARSQFPATREIRVGEKISLAFADGEERVMRIVEQDEDQVTLDANHPLAGLDLTFALQLEAILPGEKPKDAD